ncbi:MAG: hypothetical protein ACLVJB_07150 [Christensenellales bacterium]
MLGTPTKVNAAAVFSESTRPACDPRWIAACDAGVTISLNAEVAHVRQADGGLMWN